MVQFKYTTQYNIIKDKNNRKLKPWSRKEIYI